MAAPETSDWLQREPQLRQRAGYIALLGVALFVVSIFVQTSIGGDDLDTDAGLLTQYADDGSTLLLGRILYSLCMLCLIPALYVLFKAGQARSAGRVRSSMVAFAFIGPVLLAAQAPLLAVGLKDAGEQFADERPALEAKQNAAEAPPAQGGGDGSGAQQGTQADGGAGANDAAQGGGQGQQQGDEVTTTTPAEQDSGESTGTEGTTTDEGGEDSNDDDLVEQRAEDLVEDNGTVSFSRALLLPALLGMVTAMVFFNLWAMRTGLLTRFMASFGMALGVSLILLPFSQLVVIFWFLVLGLIYIGRWPRGRPPAWDAGRAIPWLRPGEEPPDDGPDGPGGPGGGAPPSGPIEGSGREMSGDAPDFPTDIPDRSGELPPAPDEGGNGSNGQQPPRKRKRRG